MRITGAAVSLSACVCVCVCLYICVRVAASHFTLSYTNFHALCVCVNARKEKMPTEEDEPARWTKGRVSKSLMSPKPDR